MHKKRLAMQTGQEGDNKPTIISYKKALNILKWILDVFKNTIKYIQEHFKTFVLLSIIAFFALSNNSDTTTNADTGANYNTLKIELSGMILSSKKIIKQVKQALSDDKIKAVILQINSPGGAIAPSSEISEAIKLLSSKKLVVAYGNGIMASGSYYSAIWADKLFASKASIVGSIGVIINGFDASELMGKVGLKTQVIKVGSVKEAGSVLKAWSKKERDELQSLTQNMYDMFVDDVANARAKNGIKKSKHKIWADAHVFLAKRAKEMGLIDEVGNIFDVEKYIHNELKLGEEKIIYKPKPKQNEFLELIGKNADDFEESFQALAFYKLMALYR